MSVGCWRRAAVIGSLLLLCSLGFGDWTKLNSGTTVDLNGIHFPEGTQVGYAVGAGGTILKTIDGGGTWVAQTSNTGNQLLSVYFLNNDNGFAVGWRGTIVKTTDGGTTWTASTQGSAMLNKVQFPGSSLTGYIGYPDGPAKVLKTVDGGSNWTGKPVGGPMSMSTSVGMATDDIGVVVGPGGFVWGTANGFDSGWAQGPQTIADMVAAAFSPEDPNKGYLIGNDSVHGLIRHTATFGTPLWDSVRCWYVTTLRAVDVPTNEVAYVCGDSAGAPVIMRSVAPTDFFRTTLPSGLTGSIADVCFPSGADTGYAVGAAGTILRTNNGGIPLIPGVAEGKAPVVTRAAIRVVSNPSRHGIALHSDADVNVSVFDATGRVVKSQAATKGLNFVALPMGAYFVKAGASTTRAVVTD